VQLSDLNDMQALLLEQLQRIETQKYEMEFIEEVYSTFERDHPSSLSPESQCSELFNEQTIDLLHLTSTTIG
jgi:hypothetical protein